MWWRSGRALQGQEHSESGKQPGRGWRRQLGAGLLASSLAASTQAFPTFDVWRVMPSAPGTLPGDLNASISACQAGSESLAALTLPQAIGIALCQHPQTRQSWAQAQAQAAQWGQMRGAWLPTLSVSINKSRDALDTRQRSSTPLGEVEQRSDNVITAYGRNATLNWLLLDGGSRSANIEQARQNFLAALAVHDGTLQVVFTQAAQSYYEAVAAEATLVATRSAEESTLGAWQAAQAKEANGSGVKAESLKAKTAHAQAVANRIKAEGGVRMAKGALANALGLDARNPITLDANTVSTLMKGLPARDTDAWLADIDRLITETLQTQPAVRNAMAQLAAAEARLSGVTAEGLPSLSANIGRYINGRPNTQLTSTHSFETLSAITLSVPLFEGFSRNYKIMEASAQVEARRADLANAKAQASLDVWRHHQTLLTETASVAASEDLLSSGQEANEAAQARFKAGAIDLMALLDSQKELSEARQERIRAVSAWHLARLRLLGSLGKAGLWALPSPSNPTSP
jgi:outer membrane protein